MDDKDIAMSKRGNRYHARSAKVGYDLTALHRVAATGLTVFTEIKGGLAELARPRATAP